MIVANKNKIVETANNMSEISGTGRSLWKDARTRFIHNKAATLSLFLLLAIVIAFVEPEWTTILLIGYVQFRGVTKFSIKVA